VPDKTFIKLHKVALANGHRRGAGRFGAKHRSPDSSWPHP
jgi:hypothetical protein